MKFLTYLLPILMTVNFAFAARSTNTDDAPTMGKGAFLVEVGTDYVKSDEAGNKTIDTSIQPYYGVLDMWDVSIAVPLTYTIPADEGIDGEFGVGNVTLWNKVNFMSEDAGKPLGLSAVVEVALPTGDPDKGIGSDKTDVHGHLVVTKTLAGGIVGIHGNIGYTYPELPREDSYPASEEPEGSFDYSAAVGAGLSDIISVFAEVYGSYVSDAEEQPVNVNTGAGFDLGILELDIHGDFGVTDVTSEYGFGGGVTFGI